MALKINRLSLRNWMKISEADILFPDHGLVMVLGRNAASGGALESVGSGKTSIGEALTRTLFGHSGRFNHAKGYSTDQKGDTYLRLECDVDGQPLLVESGYKCEEMSKTGEALRYTWNDQVIQRGHINETRDQLNKLLGVEPMLIPWTVFIDGDDLRFNKMSQTNSVEMVLAALRQPPWGTYHEAAKQVAAEFRQTIQKLSGSVESETLRLGRARDDVADAKEGLEEAQASYQAAVEALEKTRARLRKEIEGVESHIDGLLEKRKQIAAEIKQIENDNAQEHHKLEIELKDGEEHLRKMRERQKDFRTKWQEAHEASTEARSHYRAYRDSEEVCPTCRRPMGDVKIDAERLAKLKDAATEAQAKVTERAQLMEAGDADTEALEEKLDDLRESIQELSVEKRIRGLSERDERLERTIKDYQEQADGYRVSLEESTVSDKEVQRAKTLLQERKRVVREAKEALVTAQEKLAEAEVEANVINYWVVAYSPYGIPNMVLRDAIAPLNQEARRISALMTGGTIDVSYATRKALASGAEKAQLVINVNNTLGSDDIAGSSKGESRLTNLVIAETLSEVGQVTRQAGYRWYDEILTNLDKTSRTNILRYLRELAERMKVLIFVVDHHTETANFADYVLKVEKLTESAKVGWV